MKAMRFGQEYDGTRGEKAAKIVRILQDFSGKDLEKFTCLDLGCAKGVITNFLMESFSSIIGLDVDESLVRSAVRLVPGEKVFVVGDGGQTPFPSCSFDVVICAQVYEHTPDQKALAIEIWRLLKPGGMCFFSGPNRWSPIEEHYWLPFLSWLPQRLANIYMRLARRGPVYDVHPLYYWQLKNLFHRFEIHDYTARLLHQPTRFGMSVSHPLLKVVRLFPDWFYQLFVLWLPNYNWILVKRGE